MSNPNTRRRTAAAVHVLPPVACGLLGWAVWHVFRPGLIASDGMWQLHQAWAGSYHDWFPPAMAVALRQVLLATGSVGTATLLQAVLGCLGVYHVARAALRFAFPHLLTPGREAVVAVGVLVLLLVPLSPLAYFLVYLQNDGWLIVALLWAVAGWLSLGCGARFAAWWWAAAVLGSAGVVLARHNAVVLLPIFAALAALAARPRGRYAALAAAVLVVALPLIAEKWVVRAFNVARIHPEDQIIALDLVGVCVERDDLRPLLPYTDAHLFHDRFREKYIPGFVNVMYLYSPAEARPTAVDYVGKVENGVQQLGSRHDELADDYRRAVRHAPGTLAAVKAKAFLTYLLHDHGGEHWHPTGIIDNTLGLQPNRQAAAVRSALAAVDSAVNGSPGLRFLCTNHLPWVLLNVLAAVVVGYVAVRGGGRRWRVGLLLVLIPLTYTGSHLLAIAGPFYRYLYPATLLCQIGLLVLLVGVGVPALRKVRAAAMNPVAAEGVCVGEQTAEG